MSYSSETIADSDLRAYWRLGEAVGASIAVDSSGRSHDGTYSVITPTLEQTGLIYGDSDTCVYFPVDGYVQLTDHADLEPGTAFTLELWVKRVVIEDDNNFYSKGTGGNFYGMANGTFRVGNDAGTVTTSTSTALGDTNTHHVVVTYAGTGAGNTLIYIDGTEGHTDGAQIGTGLSANASNPRIGNHISGGEHVKALIDEVAIYGAVKSSSWVAARYALGSTEARRTVLPDADVTTTGWTTTPLWSKVDDDPTAPDGTVITATGV